MHAQVSSSEEEATIYNIIICAESKCAFLSLYTKQLTPPPYIIIEWYDIIQNVTESYGCYPSFEKRLRAICLYSLLWKIYEGRWCYNEFQAIISHRFFYRIRLKIRFYNCHRQKTLFVMLVGHAEWFEAHLCKVFLPILSDYELVRCLDVSLAQLCSIIYLLVKSTSLMFFTY